MKNTRLIYNDKNRPGMTDNILELMEERQLEKNDEAKYEELGRVVRREIRKPKNN